MMPDAHKGTERMDIKKYYANLVGWTVVGIDFEDTDGDMIPTLRMTKAGHEDLYVDVYCDPEGNGSGFLDLYQPPATWKQ